VTAFPTLSAETPADDIRPPAARPRRSVSWRRSLLIGWAVVFLIHLPMAMRMHWFTGLPDEAGYLGNARWLSGPAPIWPMGKASFYYIGYPALLVPLHLLVRSPQALYHGVLTVNCVLMASLFPRI
jgi:hypothetical protein